MHVPRPALAHILADTFRSGWCRRCRRCRRYRRYIGCTNSNQLMFRGRHVAQILTISVRIVFTRVATKPSRRTIVGVLVHGIFYFILFYRLINNQVCRGTYYRKYRRCSKSITYIQI